MKFLVVYTFLLSILLGATAAPTQATILPLKILNEHDQVQKYGQDKIDDLKEAARQSQINVELAIRVVLAPKDHDNIVILRKAFGDKYRPHLKEIHKSLIKIRDGVLEVEDANVAVLPDLCARVNLNTGKAEFGPRFHKLDGYNKAGTVLHERSHAFAKTSDYFSKKDGRGLNTQELAKEAHWVGYQISADWPHLSSTCKARNADSFELLGDLARRQYDVRHATPTPKENPIILIIDEEAQLKKYGQTAVDNVKNAALQARLNVRKAIDIVDHSDNPEYQKILRSAFGEDVGSHLKEMRASLEKIDHQVLVLRDIKRTGPSGSTYNKVTKEGCFSLQFQDPRVSDKERAGLVLELLAIAVTGETQGSKLNHLHSASKYKTSRWIVELSHLTQDMLAKDPTSHKDETISKPPAKKESTIHKPSLKKKLSKLLPPWRK